MPLALRLAIALLLAHLPRWLSAESVSRDVEIKIEPRDMHLDFAKIGCPGYGPFASVSECMIVCEDSQCSNAIEIATHHSYCNGILRSKKGTTDSLKGQLVELVSFKLREPFTQHAKSCALLGAKLIGSDLDRRLQALEETKVSPRQAFIAKNGTMMFLHSLYAGGTPLCGLARENGLRTPMDKQSGRRSKLGGELMGKHCNPDFYNMKAWFGSLKDQLSWAKTSKVQFYGHQLFLPKEENLPFGNFVMGAQVRHPAHRMHIMYETNPFAKGKPALSVTGNDIDTGNVSANLHSIFSQRLADVRKIHAAAPHTNVLSYAERMRQPKSYTKKSQRSTFHFDPSRPSFKDWLLTKQRNPDLGALTAMMDFIPRKKQHLPDISLIKRAETLYYNETHLEAAKHILEKFSFVMLFEGQEWLTPAVLRSHNFSSVDLKPHHMRGGREEAENNILEQISHDPVAIESLMAAENLDLQLYAHATDIACLQYHNRNVIREQRRRRLTRV